MLLGWRTDRRASDLDGVPRMNTNSRLNMTHHDNPQGTTPGTTPTELPAWPGEGLVLAPGGGGDGLEVLLGGREQLVALALSFGGQQGIAAHDEPLAREILAGDLGQVPVVEERGRHGACTQK